MTKEITMSILVNNHFGVLTKIASMFSRRGINIRSLSAGETQDPRLTRMTIYAEGDEVKLAQIYSQMHKLEDVRTLCLLEGEDVHDCAIVLAKLKPGADQEQFNHLLEEYGASLHTIAGGCIMLQASGGMNEMNKLIVKLRQFQVIELATSGLVALDNLPQALGE